MTTTTIRVSTHTHQLLHELAQASGKPMQQVLEAALEQYRRQQILAAANAAYATLQADPEAMAAAAAEWEEWDQTLADGLERL